MNIIQQLQHDQFVKRDIWREARAKSGAGWRYKLAIWILGLFGKKPAPLLSMRGLLREQRAFVVDLSSYQPNCNVEAMIDAGVTHFFLRMLYIGVYVMDQWQLTEDLTYRAYYDRIRAYAKKTGKHVWIGGYLLYTAGVELQDFVNSHIYTDWIGQIMGTAYRPDVLFIDDEIDTWWEHNAKISAGPVNQIRGCEELRRKLWERFHIVVGHYSGRWFINKYKDAYMYMFDRINKPGGLEKAMPIWTAWYPATFSEVWADLWAALAKLPTPSSTQKVDLLDAPGSYSPCDLWQFTGSLITPLNKNAAGQASGVDASISLNSLKDFNYALGITTAVTPQPDDPPVVVEPPADLAALTVRVTELERWRKS